jgi:hypothetical protein
MRKSLYNESFRYNIVNMLDEAYFSIQLPSLFSCWNHFIGEVHNFIGDFQILLAKKLIYGRFRPAYWRKSIFIGELEIPNVFSNSRKKNRLIDTLIKRFFIL